MSDLDIYDETFNSALELLTSVTAGHRYVGRRMIKILADASGATEKDTETFYLCCLQQGVPLPPLILSDDLFEPPKEVRFF